MSDDRWTPAQLKPMQWAGDPLADDTVSALFEHGQVDAVNDLMRALIKNDAIPPQGLPPQVYGYLEQSQALPAWADLSSGGLVERGEALFVRHGMIGFSILSTASLPIGYAAPVSARCLGSTQQLETHIFRRLMETMQFVTDVMSGGGLRPGGQGIRSVQKVRLMHGAIRNLILSPSHAARAEGQAQELHQVLSRLSWDPKEDGVPVNQLLMSGTTLVFSYVVLRSLKRLGIDLEPEDETAYLHCWNVIGSVMGVDPVLLLPRPERYEDAEALFNAIFGLVQGASPEGVALTSALLRFLEGLMGWEPDPFRHVPRILIHELAGAEVAGMLGVGLDWADRLAAEGTLRGLRGLDHLDTAIDTLPVTRVAAEWLFHKMVSALAGMARGGDRAPFAIPTHLAEAWRVSNGAAATDEMRR